MLFALLLLEYVSATPFFHCGTPFLSTEVMVYGYAPHFYCIPILSPLICVVLVCVKCSLSATLAGGEQCQQAKEVILPMWSVLLRPHLEYHVQLSAPWCEKYMDILDETNKGLQRSPRNGSTSHKKV